MRGASGSSGIGGSARCLIFRFRCGLNAVPAGIRWPRMTFSFRPDQRIDRAGQSRFGQNLGGFLEAGGRDEGFALQRRLGDAQQQRLAAGGLGLLGLGGLLAGGFGGFVGFLELGLGDDVAFLEARAAGLGDLDALSRSASLPCAEAELVDHFARQELGVAGIFDLHLAEHLVEDDLNVLVVDLHALRTIDVLHFGQQVLIERFFALDAEDVVRNERAADERHRRPRR